MPARWARCCGAASCARARRRARRACRSRASRAWASFHRGETIGIVGPTGAGKSTLLSLLLRFYDPTEGAILFDGVDVRDLRHRDVMRQSSIVLQEPFLFINTIANNIRISRPSATL